MKKSLFVLFAATMAVFEISTSKATSVDYPSCVREWVKHPMVKLMPKELLRHAEYFQNNIFEKKPNDKYKRITKQRLVKACTIELVKKMPSQWLNKDQLGYLYFIHLLEKVKYSDEKNYNNYAKKIVEIIKMNVLKTVKNNKKKKNTAIVIRKPSIVECIFEKLYNDQTRLYKNLFTERRSDALDLIFYELKMRYTTPFAFPAINFYSNKQFLGLPKFENQNSPVRE